MGKLKRKEYSKGGIRKAQSGNFKAGQSREQVQTTPGGVTATRAKKETTMQRVARLAAEKKKAEDRLKAKKSLAEKGAPAFGKGAGAVGKMGSGTAGKSPLGLGTKGGFESATLKKGATSKSTGKSKQRTYKEANDASNGKLGSWINQRKGLKKGTPEYNVLQNKINKAYGKGPTNRPTAPKAKIVEPTNEIKFESPTPQPATPATPTKPQAKKPAAPKKKTTTDAGGRDLAKVVSEEIKRDTPASKKKELTRREKRKATRIDRRNKPVETTAAAKADKALEDAANKPMRGGGRKKYQASGRANMEKMPTRNVLRVDKESEPEFRYGTGMTNKDTYSATTISSDRDPRAKKKFGGRKNVPAGSKGKGLSKLPTSVRNKMGFKKHGGKAKKMYGGMKDRRK